MMCPSAERRLLDDARGHPESSSRLDSDSVQVLDRWSWTVRISPFLEDLGTTRCKDGPGRKRFLEDLQGFFEEFHRFLVLLELRIRSNHAEQAPREVMMVRRKRLPVDFQRLPIKADGLLMIPHAGISLAQVFQGHRDIWMVRGKGPPAVRIVSQDSCEAGRDRELPFRESVNGFLTVGPTVFRGSFPWRVQLRRL